MSELYEMARKKYPEDCVVSIDGCLDDLNEEPRSNYLDGCRDMIALIRKKVNDLYKKYESVEAKNDTQLCYQGGRLIGYEDVKNLLDKLENNKQ